MADPLTANKFLAQPTRGSDAGTWDTPMNANSGIIDNSFGGVATIALTNSPVTLSAAQYQNVFIKLTGVLSANVALTFPGGVGSYFTILNQTTGSSAFVVTMTTTAVGAQTIGIPPGQNTKVMLDGTNPQFENLPHNVGGYWHHAGSSTPSWVAACTVPPYLNCDGSGFSAGTYPALNAYLGGTTLPDARGRALFALDQGTGRNGGSFLQGGGAAQATIAQSNLPNVNLNPNTATVNSNQGNIVQGSIVFNNVNLGAGAPGLITQGGISGTISINLPTYSLGGSGTPLTTLPPSLVSGIILVRAG